MAPSITCARCGDIGSIRTTQPISHVTPVVTVYYCATCNHTFFREHAALDAVRLATIIDSSDEAIVAKNLDGVIQSWNPAAEHIFGFTAAEVIGQHVTILIPSDRRAEEEWILAKVKAGERVHLETVRLTKTGKRIDASLTVAPLMDETGRVVGGAKLLRDVSEQKRMNEALSHLRRKLITAQEEERARIARELHDDIAQRLALLAIGLASVEERVHGSPGVSRELIDLQSQVSEMARDVETLSHELHSSKVKLLGVAAAMRLFCSEFSGQEKVTIDFETSDIPNPLPLAISLTLLRVLQEALHNSIKHGRSQHCHVHLWAADSWIHLLVVDDGEGFDVDAAKTGRGIGLISMEERIELVEGDLSVESQPQHGTKIHARVPIARYSTLVR